MKVADLQAQLKWHRLWDLSIPRPYRMNKEVLTSTLTVAIRRFDEDGMAIEDVRTMFESMVRRNK